ncbi:MAG: Hydrogen cyanide synthase subunit HcnB [candidate division WS2 bacterium]|nr:Hydrogen cyanide synthase subunit HcnB [Candidatus Lithacetigena glycinireducens]
MEQVEILVVGGGPAGMMASLSAVQSGANVTLLEREVKLGGQLIKQTHKFFGSYKEYAGVRGIEIAEKLTSLLKEQEDKGKISILTEAELVVFYHDQTLGYTYKGALRTLKTQKMIFTTGASERMLPFPGNDLPGVYAAGAIQTLMNVNGVLPGEKYLMVGAGNIGLIVSYQLLQAGAKVLGVVEAMPRIGGYLVHASKIRRMGVPIYTSHTILEAHGKDRVEEAVIIAVDNKYKPIPGTEKVIKVDVISLAVGLNPLGELLEQRGIKFCYIPELGGFVPWHDENLRTSHPDVYVAGDLAGIEEATTAMLQGELAGLVVAGELGYGNLEEQNKIGLVYQRLKEFRTGPKSEKTREGQLKLIDG